jgi:hypothetical protein
VVAERSTIAGAVRELLERHPLGDVSLNVLEDLARQDRDWWHVPVQPSRRIESTSQFYDVLARVEEELDAERGLNVLLVPTLPDE